MRDRELVPLVRELLNSVLGGSQDKCEIMP